MSDETNAGASVPEESESVNPLVTFCTAIQELAPGITDTINSYLTQHSAWETAKAGREAAAGNAEKAIESLIRSAETSDEAHNERAARILDIEAELRNLLEMQRVSASPLADSLKDSAVSDEQFAMLDATAKSLRGVAVKLIESSAALVPGTDVDAVKNALPTISGSRSSGSGNAATGQVRPWYSRDFFVDGKKAKPLADGGKPNLAAAAKQVEMSQDEFRAALLKHFGEDEEKWNNSKSDPLNVNGHTVYCGPKQKKSAEK